METNFDYYAFISYHRKDDKWAKWLQNKLENYKLPAIFRKGNADLPKYIRPVFRDQIDSSSVMASLQESLERSKYLIVICSPEAAKSKWIGIDIDAFIEMGRSDRIIPFIVDGVPNSCDSRECLHPLIKEKIPEPLGFNINEIGKQKAFLKAAGKILNLNFGDLWQRGHIPQRKRWLIAVVAGLLFLVALGLVRHYHSPKKAYFDAGDKPFEEGYAKAAYKYDEQGNVIETAYFDTDGKPHLLEGNYAKITYKYDGRGERLETAYFDTNGNTIAFFGDKDNRWILMHSGQILRF